MRLQTSTPSPGSVRSATVEQQQIASPPRAVSTLTLGETLHLRFNKSGNCKEREWENQVKNEIMRGVGELVFYMFALLHSVYIHSKMEPGHVRASVERCRAAERALRSPAWGLFPGRHWTCLPETILRIYPSGDCSRGHDARCAPTLHSHLSLIAIVPVISTWLPSLSLAEHRHPLTLVLAPGGHPFVHNPRFLPGAGSIPFG